MSVDLDALLRLAEKPDCNMDELITLADAVKPLIERVRVLERTLEILEGYDLAVCSCWDCPARETCKDLDKPCFSIVLDYTRREAENGL